MSEATRAGAAEGEQKQQGHGKGQPQQLETARAAMVERAETVRGNRGQ